VRHCPEQILFRRTRYNQYLMSNFAGFGNGTSGTQIGSQYATTTQASVARSYYDMQTDMGLYCPNVQLGLSASQLVYVSVVAQAPSKPIPITPTFNVTDPFHLWDYILLTQSWNFFQTSSGGSIFDAGGGSGAVAAFTPNTTDIQLGVTLRNQIYQFINKGQISDFTPISSSDPNYYSVIVQGTSDTNSSTAANVINYRRSYCDLLKSPSVGLNPDSRFWWIN